MKLFKVLIKSLKNIYTKISKTPVNCEDEMDSFTGIFQGFHCLIDFTFSIEIRLKKYNKSIRKDMYERHSWDGDASKKENQKTLNSVFG